MSTKKKILKTGFEARSSLMKGAKTLSDAVKVTLGPFSQHAAIEKGDEIIDDGVTVAREIVSGCIDDEIEHRGARMLLQVATKTEEKVGDATTTATILGYEITKEAAKLLSDDKTFIGKKTPSEVVAQIEKERKEVTEKLVAMAMPITSKEELVDATTVSASDPELGKLIGGLQFDLGKEGIVLSEETADVACSIERVNGIRIDNGFGTSVIVNNQEKQSLEISETRVILTNHIFHDLACIKDIGQSLAKMGVRSLAIIARAFDENAIRDCLANIEKGFSIFPVNAPYTDMNEVMKDLSAVTGAKYINLDERNLESLQLSDVGYAEKIVVTRAEGVITGKTDEKISERIAKRIDDIEKEITGTASEFRKANLNVRIAQLKNGFGIVKIGAASDVQRKYLKRKADDAVGTARAALQEGVVPGGGMAFKIISDTLPEGYILKQPLTEIYNQIISSAPPGFVIESKIVDSVKVLRVALEQACSVAAIFANAGIAIAEEKGNRLDLALQRLASTDK